MRYLVFSLTSLFLLACGDTDNPVVSTAPAGKATVDLTAEECAAATSLPDGFLERAREADPNIDADELLTMWKAHECDDWALWGLTWLLSLEVEGDFEIVVILPETTELERAYSTIIGSPNVEPPLPLDPGLNTSQNFYLDYYKPQWDENELIRTRALPTVRVSGSRDGGTAIFTFTRNNVHLDEPLTVQFTVTGGSRIFSGFGAGDNEFDYRVAISRGEKITVRLREGWQSKASDSYARGNLEAEVYRCPTC